MTYLEKAKTLNPDLTISEIIELWCPDHVLHMYGQIRLSCSQNGCKTCWNREIPEVKE